MGQQAGFSVQVVGKNEKSRWRWMTLQQKHSKVPLITMLILKSQKKCAKIQTSIWGSSSKSLTKGTNYKHILQPKMKSTWIRSLNLWSSREYNWRRKIRQYHPSRWLDVRMRFSKEIWRIWESKGLCSYVEKDESTVATWSLTEAWTVERSLQI